MINISFVLSQICDQDFALNYGQVIHEIKIEVIRLGLHEVSMPLLYASMHLARVSLFVRAHSRETLQVSKFCCLFCWCCCCFNPGLHVKKFRAPFGTLIRDKSLVYISHKQNARMRVINLRSLDFL